MGGFFTSKQKTVSGDPFKKGSPEAGYANQTLSSLFGRSGEEFQLPPGITDADLQNLLSGPTAQSRAAADEAMRLYQTGGGRDLFGTGVAGIKNTAGGAYLDPMSTPAFRGLSDALMASGRDMFGDLVGSIRNDAARSGGFDSSARLASENAAAGRVATATNEQLGRAAFGQYGAERGYQEDANRLATMLGPEMLQGIMQMSGEQQRQVIEALNARLNAALAPEQVAQSRYGQLLDALGLFKRNDSTTKSTPSGAAILGAAMPKINLFGSSGA